MKTAALLLLLMLAACQTRIPTPNERLAGFTEDFKAQCTLLCDQEEGQSSIFAKLPADTQVYSTDEALCALRNNALFCARCSCQILPAQILNLTVEENVTCILQKGEVLSVQCT
jgi:hypothetical protein